ncbi:hypothetical protein KC19_5G153500 [Ceratodon purpureus]|uniref:Uncharacterized protein n=1 Tax=Ceratodon purpureus TaxID=3225 RepID=A0A8T0I3N4_CERPU|nr:hypothetical protein KC19_5G153500 [Ceratodon purpureus]
MEDLCSLTSVEHIVKDGIPVCGFSCLHGRPPTVYQEMRKEFQAPHIATGVPPPSLKFHICVQTLLGVDPGVPSRGFGRVCFLSSNKLPLAPQKMLLGFQ